MGWFSTDDLVLGRRWLLKERLQKNQERHAYILGGSGTGKTSLLFNILNQKLCRKGISVGCIDVHGDLNNKLEKAAYNVLSQKEKRQRLVILDPTRGSFGYNPLEVRPGEKIYPKVLEIQSVIKKLWTRSWGERMADILRNANMVMAEKNLTMCQIPKFLTNDVYRDRLVQDIKNVGVKEYWTERFGAIPSNIQAQWVESTLNKLSNFLSDPQIRRVVCQRHSTINFRQLLDNPAGTILLITLPKGIIKDNVYLLAGFLISGIQEAALSRTDIPEPERKPFSLVIDEFQNMGAGSQNFEEVLSESRKYGLKLYLSHQNIDQIDDDLLSSILGNTTCQIIFRTSRKDAEILAKEIFNINIDDLEWERENGESHLNLPERWEEHINSLSQLRKREAYVSKKGVEGANLIRTLDMEEYEATPRQLEKQAKEVMATYIKSKEEIEKEQKQIKEELSLKEPTYKG